MPWAKAGLVLSLVGLFMVPIVFGAEQKVQIDLRQRL
jgi:hypothetical protein